MELPQPCRPLGVRREGAETHDFLSLYTAQQDPTPSFQGGFQTTHDFLQPLQQVGETSAKTQTTLVEKPPPPPPALSHSLEHILPGGIGTYSISHISYFNQTVPTPEGTIFTLAQESSSSYTGSGPTAKKGKRGKENVAGRTAGRKGPVNTGEWTPERLQHSYSFNHRNSFSSSSSCRPSGQKKHGFMEMIRSAKNSTQEDEIDDDDEFPLKKELFSIDKGELRVKIDGKSADHKANTPRSKHSATEQRRRSKINDRFQMLREIIPHADQKRDKASFLLEVIEYIQSLQEKVHKYEGSYQEWDNERAKLTPLRNNHGAGESYGNQPRGLISEPGPAIVFAAKFDDKNVTVSPIIPSTDMSNGSTFKAINKDHGTGNKGMHFPVSMQSNIFMPVRSGGAVAQLTHKIGSDAENTASQQICQPRFCASESTVASEKLKEQDLTIEGGTLGISSVYSKGLLTTLTQALQSSGVDMTQASISVQIELGKDADSRSTSVTTIAKDNEVPSRNRVTTRSRVATSDHPAQDLKRLKTSRN